MEVIRVTSGWKHLFAGLDSPLHFYLSVASVLVQTDKDLSGRTAWEGCPDWQ